MELTGWNRQKSTLSIFLIIALSLHPCVLGCNVWAWDGFAIFRRCGAGCGEIPRQQPRSCRWASLVYTAFLRHRYGWGWDNYKKGISTGKGDIKMHDWMFPDL